MLEHSHVQMVGLFVGIRLETADVVRALGFDVLHQRRHGDFKLRGPRGRAPDVIAARIAFREEFLEDRLGAAVHDL